MAELYFGRIHTHLVADFQFSGQFFDFFSVHLSICILDRKMTSFRQFENIIALCALG